jgi:hypothetical protein
MILMILVILRPYERICVGYSYAGISLHNKTVVVLREIMRTHALL